MWLSSKQPPPLLPSSPSGTREVSFHFTPAATDHYFAVVPSKPHSPPVIRGEGYLSEDGDAKPKMCGVLKPSRDSARPACELIIVRK